MIGNIHTLQEFMTHTKGIIYIMSILCLIGFVCFWRFLTKNDRDREMK